MPTVREYGSQQAQNAPQAANRVSGQGVSANTTSSPLTGAARSIPTAGPMRQVLPTDSFGVAPINPEAVGQGISNFGKSVAALQQRIATTEAEEALVAFEREKNALFYTPKTGYFNTQGRDAYDQAKPFTENLEKVRNKYSEKLKSTEARDMFVRASDAHITRAQSDVMRHASEQFNAWESATISAQVENTLENAALYWNDPEARGLQLELGRQGVIDKALTMGMNDPKYIAEQLQNYNSQFAVNTIEAAMATSASAGQVALADHKELLEGPDLVQIQQKIDQKFKVEQQQRVATTAVVTAQSLVTQYGEMPNARSLIIEELSGIEDPDLKQAATREAMYQLNNLKTAKAEAQAETYQAAEEFILGGGSIDQFIASDPQGWADMEPSKKRSLMAGPTVTTDARTWLEVTSLPPEELAKVNPAEYVGIFTKADLDKLSTLVTSAKEGGVEARLGQTIASQTNLALEAIIGESSTRWTAYQAQQADAIHSTINAVVMDASKAKGSKLSNDEYKVILDNFSREYIIAESTGKIVTDRQLMRDEIDMSLRDIPAQDITEITAVLRAQGKAVTSDQIITMYQRGLRTQGQ